MKKFKFNFVDTIIILMVLAVITVGWLFINNRSSDGSSSKFSYDILLKEIPIETVNAITKGSDVFDGVKIINIGVINDFSYKKSQYYEYSEQTGEYVFTEVPDMYDVTINVQAGGTFSGLTHIVNEYEIYVGKAVDIKSVGFVGHGVIVAVNEVE
ncbi:MAG: DUF4330 family protein [Clostridia bacterium]|nr:DUF4330 family protein [Clostridia bacterium]